MNFRLITASFFLMCLAFTVKAQFPGPSSSNIIFPNKNFDGVNNFTDSYQPPDIHGAVGTNYVMGISNLGFEILDKTGNVVSGPTSDVTFFSPLASSGKPVRDGRLAYDPFGKRWTFIVLYEPAKGKSKGFFMAISATDDPNGSWNMWAISVSVNVDYPTLGFNKNWICVDNNRGSQLYVFDKQYMYSHSSQDAPSYKTFSKITGIWQSCLTLDSAQSDLYLVNNADSKRGKIALGKITGTGNAPVFDTLPSIITGYTWSSPANIGYPELGFDHTFKCGGQDNMMNAVYINNALWCTQAIGFLFPTRVGFQWWEIDPEQSSVLQFERIQDSTGMYYYSSPSIAVDYHNNVLVGFSIFSKTAYISTGYLTHLASENDNSQDTVYCYMNGLAVDAKKSWGDFSNSVLDPSDHSLWTVQAYANGDHDWTTRWANIKVNKSAGKISILPKQLNVTVYPNPSQNKLTIDFGNHDEIYDVNVLNGNGEFITKWSVSSNESTYEMNTSSFPDGNYFLQVNSKSGSRILKFEVKR